MYCQQALYVNWGNLPHMSMDFGPLNLFSGGNGSGKTTAADGLQSLMTAAHENLFTYNPGQDETTQRGRGGKQVRTLASYILGCDDGAYARLRPTDGYVAANFAPSQGENAEGFCALMGVRARLDKAASPRQARQDLLWFFILPKVALSLDDLVIEDSGGKYVLPLNEAAARLSEKYGAAQIEAFDKKGPYLRRLYAALRGQRSSVSDREAKHAARTFANFMAYKPVKSIHEFVAREILEPRDLGEDIRQVSELMKTIHGMEAETRQLAESIRVLDSAHEAAKRYRTGWIEIREMQLAKANFFVNTKQQEYLAQRQLLGDTQTEASDTENTIAQCQHKRRELQEALIELKAQRQGIDSLKEKDALDTKIETLKENLLKQVPILLTQNTHFSNNVTHCQILLSLNSEISLGAGIEEFNTAATIKQLKALCTAGTDTGLNAPQLLTKDWLGLAELEAKCISVKSLEAHHHTLWTQLFSREADGRLAFLQRVHRLIEKKRDALQRQTQQCEQLSREIQRLDHEHVNYPPAVSQVVDAIAQSLPQAKPCVLCDFIDIQEPEWQMAIEGYIGGARFSIIVEPEYEAEAIRLVRGMKAPRGSVRVIQGEKVRRDAARVETPPHSIVSIMEFQHLTAEYFMRASYGNVLRVDDEEALRHTARGLTAGGIGSGNYSMFRCDLPDAQLVFGKAARGRARSALKRQRQQLEQQRENAEKELQQWLQAQQAIESLKPLQLSQTLDLMLNTYRDLERCERSAASIATEDHEAMDKTLKELQQEFQAADDQSKSLSESLGAKKQKIEQLKRIVDRLSEDIEKLQDQQDSAQHALSSITELCPDFDEEQSLSNADQRSEDGANIEREIHAAHYGLDSQERDLNEHLRQHNQAAPEHSQIPWFSSHAERHDEEFFKHILMINKQVLALINSLKNNVLVGKQEQLAGLRESFNTAFVTHLCHGIYQSIAQGKDILENLNRELAHHRFGADQERFYFAYDWVPEFKEYWQFFKTLIDTPNLGDGHSLFDVALDKKSEAVRDRLVAMLLDKDEQSAMRELQRISDYRNYRQYEIFKEPLNKPPIALSTYGTGSGGQLETPAYIIRSAAVTAAFKFGEGACHCRLVLVDEAFSKMDETRSREVIQYLTETLGLQLVFIMPTSKSGPFLDMVSHHAVYSKCPTQAPVGELSTRVLVDRKICNTEKIQALWTQHRTQVRQQAMLDFMDGI